MTNSDRDHALMEGERIGAWDAYFSVRPLLVPAHERIFGAGFDRGWRAQATRVAELEQQLESAQEDADDYRKARAGNNGRTEQRGEQVIYTEAEIERAARILCMRWYDNEAKYQMQSHIALAVALYARRGEEIEAALEQAKAKNTGENNE